MSECVIGLLASVPHAHTPDFDMVTACPAMAVLCLDSHGSVVSLMEAHVCRERQPGHPCFRLAGRLSPSLGLIGPFCPQLWAKAS